LAALHSIFTTSKLRFSKLRENLKKSLFFKKISERGELAVLSALKQIVRFEKLVLVFLKGFFKKVQVCI
jgi:hypothetical protein